MSATDPRSIRVLHVDDEPDFAELAATFLERERETFEVSTATSASEGLAILDDAAAEPIDCIVSDYDMPGMDGLEFLETVRETHPELPFVLFTGRGSEEIASRAISAGVTDYLNKGSGTDQYTVLANRIENAVSQHRAERELRRSTERIRKLYGGVTDAIFVLDSEWRFTHLNERAEELLQRSESELVGEDVCEMFAAAAGTTFQEQYERTMHERVSVSFEEFYPPLDTWFRVRAVPTGEGLTAHFRDITGKKERERELERYEAAVETIDDAVYVLDEGGRFELVNDAFTDLTGYEAEAVLGSGVEIIKDEATVERFEALLGEMLSAGTEETTVEFEVVGENGERIPCEDHLAPRLGSGRDGANGKGKQDGSEETEERDTDPNREFRGVAGAIREVSER